MAEGTPLQFQNDQEGKKKEEDVKIQVEPDVPKMQGVEAQNSFSNSGPWNESESGHGVMSYAVLIEPDAPPMPEVAGIWVNSVLIILLVPAVIFGLDFFVQNV